MSKVLGPLLLCSALLFLSGCDKEGSVSENSEIVPDVTSSQSVTESVSAENGTDVTETDSTAEMTDILLDDEGKVIIFNDVQEMQTKESASDNIQKSSEEKSVTENIQKSSEEKSVTENAVSESDDGVIVLPFIPLD